MRRLIGSFVVLIALVLGGPPAAAAQEGTPVASAGEASMAAAERTDTRYFLPYDRDGLKAGLTVVADERGICGFASVASPARPDAWDCVGVTANSIYDPCFENPYAAGEMACVASPFAGEVVRFSLTAPLEREKEGAVGAGEVSSGPADPWAMPWALELANGERCQRLPAIDVVQAGQPVHYGCEGGGEIVGEADRSEPRWTVAYLEAGAVGTTLVDVVVAWS